MFLLKILHKEKKNTKPNTKIKLKKIVHEIVNFGSTKTD